VNYLAYAGVLSYLGPADGPPIVPGVQIADIGGGALMAAVGILAALLARGETGRGQLVDIAMMDGAVSWNVYHTLLYLLGGTAPERGRTQLAGHHPCYAVYETRDGRYLTVGAYELHFWTTLCRHFGREDFVPHQWAEGEKREEMFRFFRDAFRRKTLAEWRTELASVDICFGPVNTLAETFADPQVRHRGMVVDVETPAGPSLTLGTPVRLSETPAGIRSTPATLGAHTDEVLASLGYDAAAIAALRASGIV
jgi:crotonobetainyl-CoA:carnitine CoA-transferase CaiB-like acyl-CoA transferase